MLSMFGVAVTLLGVCLVRIVSVTGYPDGMFAVILFRSRQVFGEYLA
jgi:hypothetical protein